MKPTNLDKLRRDGPYGSAAYRLLNTELIGPEDDRLTVTMWARLPLSSSRRYQIRDGAGALLYDTDDCHDSGNALHAAMTWLGERQKQYDAAHAAAPDPALDFATDAMHGPKDAADPLEACDAACVQTGQIGPCDRDCVMAAAPMSPEEQEKALAHLDAAFAADRQKVISEVMGMVAEPCPVCGQPNTPVHQEYEAAMSSASRAVADL